MATGSSSFKEDDPHSLDYMFTRLIIDGKSSS